jgi:hypothetical protein
VCACVRACVHTLFFFTYIHTHRLRAAFEAKRQKEDDKKVADEAKKNKTQSSQVPNAALNIAVIEPNGALNRALIESY